MKKDPFTLSLGFEEHPKKVVVPRSTAMKDVRAPQSSRVLHDVPTEASPIAPSVEVTVGDEKPAPKEPTTWTVAELGRTLRRAVESPFAAPIWVEGEVSGLRAVSSGHMYFALKDEHEDAVIDAVMYRTSITPKTRSLMVDGGRVRLRGKPGYYSPRGRVQFMADRAEATGKGAILLALEKLKEKLTKEGLFADEKKRPLPESPRIIGVVSSATGAVIHDIRKVAFRRGGAHILLAPAQVQGAGAAESIRTALMTLARVRDVDVILIARGGGSFDDLMCFNDEALVRAVAACPIPIVSAVGHEVDFTLTDFAADVRASTPSQAAELVVPERFVQRQTLVEQTARLERALRADIMQKQIELGRIQRDLGDPRLALAGAATALDERRSALFSATLRSVRKNGDLVSRLSSRLMARHPRQVLKSASERRSALEQRLIRLLRVQHSDGVLAMQTAAATLDALSPLRVLGRGYAIALDSSGKAVRRAGDVKPGDVLRLRVSKGLVVANVSETISDSMEENS